MAGQHHGMGLGASATWRLLLAVLSALIAGAPAAADSGRDPVVGFELETPDICIKPEGAPWSQKQLVELKHRAVGLQRGRWLQGKGWFLGADVQSGLRCLSLEYDLRADLGDDSGLKAATSGVAESMREVNDRELTFFVEGAEPAFRMDEAMGARRLPDADKVQWGKQATAPVMLEGIQDLMTKALVREPHPLIPRAHLFVAVVQDAWFESVYFEELGTEWVTEDVKGFLSLLLTYAKTARDFHYWNPLDLHAKVLADQGPKALNWIMSRIYWTTVYAQIKDKLPDELDLWEVLNHLACYHSDPEYDGRVMIDEQYCGGDGEDPQPNGKLSEQAWKAPRQGFLGYFGQQSTLTVKDWVESIVGRDAGSPDKLVEWDGDNFKGSMGAFGKKGKGLERVLGTSRLVPVWEFRFGAEVVFRTDLYGPLREMHDAVVRLHRKYRKEPTEGLKFS